MQRQGALDHGAFVCEAVVIDARSAANSRYGVLSAEQRKERRGRRRIADSHFAEAKELNSVVRGAMRCVGADAKRVV